MGVTRCRVCSTRSTGSAMFLAAFIIAAAGVPTGGPVSDTLRDFYDLDLRDSASAVAHVEARVTLIDGTLNVEGYTTQQPGFWRSLVRDLVVKDSSGKPLTIDSIAA